MSTTLFLENNVSGNNFNYIFKDDLESLYKRVCLAKIPEIYKDIVNRYNNFYKGVKQFINIFSTLYSKGYQKNFVVKIDFEKNNEKWSFNEKEYSMEKLIENFAQLKKSINVSLNKLYKENEILRFFMVDNYI